MSARRAAEPWHGIFPYLVSPVEPDGRIREAVLRRLTEHLIARGVHGLSPLGSTGEFSYLTSAQRVEIVRIVVDAAAGRVPVVPGVAAYGTRDAIEQTHRLLEAGADGIILILQAYLPLPPDAVSAFFAAVAEVVPCPICVYTNPRLLGVDLHPDQIVALSRLPNVRYSRMRRARPGGCSRC